MTTHPLRRIPRESRVAAVVLGVALLQVGVLAALGLGQTERRRDDAEAALRASAESAAAAVHAVCVRQISAQEDRLVAELESGPGGAAARASDALRSAPLFSHAHLLDARGGAYDVRRLPPEAPAGALDLAARRRVDALLAAERSDPAATAEAAASLATELESAPAPDVVAVALALQCGARAALVAGDPHRAAELARRTLAHDAYVAVVDDRVADGESEPFGPAAARVLCEVRSGGVATGGDAAATAFTEALLDRRVLAQRLRGVLSEPGYRVERDDCARLRREVLGLRAEHQTLVDLGLRECDDVDAALEVVRRASPAQLVDAAVRDRLSRVALPDGSLLLVAPLRDGGRWAAAAFTAPAARLRRDVVAAEVERAAAPDGVAIVVRDAAGTVVAGRADASGGPPRTLAEKPFGTALPGLVVAAVLADPSVVAREADASRRYWLWVLGAAILAVGAASLLAVRAVLREVRLARMKSDFVSNLSHELRTPLTSLRMFVETLQEGRVRDEREARECVDVIAHETDRLTSLVDRVLQFAAFSRGRAPIALRSGDAGEVVRRAAELFRKRAEAAGATLEVRIAPDLPEAILDRDAVAQVVLNLLDNAVKHAGHDRPRIRVTARPHDRGGCAILVEDDGPGIPERERELVFEEFYRGDDTLSRRTQGAGLGLALSRRIALAHGGSLAAGRSADLGGAAFLLVLPEAAVGRRLAVAAQGAR